MRGRAPHRPPLWTAAFTLVVAATALLFLGFYAALPALPLFGRACGAATGEVGWVITAFSLAALATRVAAARHLEGSCRRPLLLIGLALYSAAAALPWCAT